MSKKLKSQLLWLPVLIVYLGLPSPFGWYIMLAFLLHNFSIDVLGLFLVKTTAPEDRVDDFRAFNKCRTDALDWIIYASSFLACMVCRDYFFAATIVLSLYLELEMFRITGQVS